MLTVCFTTPYPRLPAIRLNVMNGRLYKAYRKTVASIERYPNTAELVDQSNLCRQTSCPAAITEYDDDKS